MLESFATDWPQFRGANHDGISTDRIVKQWAGAVTNPVWRVSITNCLGSLAVSGGRVFTLALRPTNNVGAEWCVALSATNGSELWAAPLDSATYTNGGVGFDDGPRSTPAVSDGSVYVLTSFLKLYRLNATNGATTWSRDLVKLYGSRIIPYQNAASPLLEDGLIFLNADCVSATLMALRTSDGSVAWRSQNEQATHATPVLATIQGVRQVIFATQSGLVSLDPQNGNLLWRFAYPFLYSGSLGASPVIDQDMVFITGAHSYGMGTVVARVGFSNAVWSATRLWSTNNPAAHWMTPVARQGFLYGMFGIQSSDSVNAQLKCVDMRTGAVKWSTNSYGRGGVALVNDHVLAITERGSLALIKPDTNAWMEIARCLAIPNYSDPTNKCWNVPAIADGRVYVRSTMHVACFDFSMPDLKLDAPEFVDGSMQLSARTMNGAPIASNRLAAMEVRTTTNVTQPIAQWSRLTNGLLLSNGVVRITNAMPASDPQRVFIISEPQ